MLGTGYFLKIAKSNSQHEKPICPNRKLAKQKIANPQKLTLAKIVKRTVQWTSQAYMFCFLKVGYVIKYSNTLIDDCISESVFLTLYPATVSAH